MESITYLKGRARLDGSKVRVNGDAISADKIVVATGSSTFLPNIPGLANITALTSTTALELNELLRSLIIIGGGYVGCELAQMFARAGTSVTLATRSRLLPETEPEISDALTGYLRDEGVTVRSGLAYQRIEKMQNGIALTVEANEGEKETLIGEQVLLATGRAPNTANLGLSEAGVDLTSNGGVSVDDRMRTSKVGVYAAGDVTGRDQFVYMAAYGAKLAALNALNGDSLVYDNSAMPWVVFTDPQVAGVGLSEAAAKAAGFETKTSIVPLDQIPRALAARDTRGLIKLVADAKTDRLLGAQILAPEGADSIQTMVLALKHGMTAKALGETVPVSDHRRRHQASGTEFRQGRQQAFMLRGIGYFRRAQRKTVEQFCTAQSPALCR